MAASPTRGLSRPGSQPFSVEGSSRGSTSSAMKRMMTQQDLQGIDGAELIKQFNANWRRSRQVGKEGALLPERLDDVEDWPPVKAIQLRPGGGVPRAVWFPLELQGRDYAHRALDMTSNALRKRFSELADRELVPLPLTEQGDPRQIDTLHRFELFKHCQENRALHGLAEALQIPGQVLKQVFGQLLEVDKTLSTEWEKSLGGEVKMVFEAAQTILCGEGIDPVWSSILAQMTEQDDLHDLFKIRRWAMRIDDDGNEMSEAAAEARAAEERRLFEEAKELQSKSRRKSSRVPTAGLDASTKTRRGSVAAHVRSAKGTMQLKLAQSSMRSMQIDMEVEDEDVVDEAANDSLHEQLDRLRDLKQKFTSQVSRLDGLDVSLERVETAATALGIVQQALRKAKQEEDESWAANSFSAAKESRKKADVDLRQTQAEVVKALEDSWEALVPAKLSNEGQRLVKLVASLEAAAREGRDYGVCEEVVGLRAESEKAMAELQQRSAGGKMAEGEGTRIAHMKAIFARCGAALEKEAALGPIKQGTPKMQVMVKAEKELVGEMQSLKIAVERICEVGVEGSRAVARAYAAEDHHMTDDEIRRVPSDAANARLSSTGSNSPESQRMQDMAGDTVARLKVSMKRMVLRQDAWKLLSRIEGAGPDLGQGIRREALERLVQSKGGGDDAKKLVDRMEVKSEWGVDRVLEAMTAPQSVVGDIKEVAEMVQEERREQNKRWKGHAMVELGGGWLSRSHGEWGTEPGNMRDPTGLCWHKNGGIVVADRSNGRVQILNLAGEQTACFADKDQVQLEGGLINPSGVCVTAEGNIVVTDRGNSRLVVISSIMTVKSKIGGQGKGEGELQGPIGVCAGRGEVVYVADYGNHRVESFDVAEGTHIRSYGGKGGVGGGGLFTYPQDVAYRPGSGDGDDAFLCVADTGSGSVVMVKEADGAVLWRVSSYSASSTFTTPSGVCFAPVMPGLWAGQSIVAVSDTGGNRLYFLDVATGKLVDMVSQKGSSEGHVSAPRAIRVDPSSGTIAVADCGNHRIVMFEHTV